jgi:hypothetical protein
MPKRLIKLNSLSDVLDLLDALILAAENDEEDYRESQAKAEAYTEVRDIIKAGFWKPSRK